jgi:hypothetical protein
MKQKNLLVFVLGFMTALVSCIESKDNAIQTEEPQFKVEQEAFKWDFKYDGKVYLDPRINKNIITTFDELMPNQQPAIDEETEVVVISRLDDVPFEQLEEAYYRGATIAVAAPSLADFNNFFGANPDWEGKWTDEEFDSALLYAFNVDGDHFLVMGTDDPSTIEDQASQAEKDLVPEAERPENLEQQAAYYNIGLWVEHLIDMKNETPEEREDKARAVARRASEDNKNVNIAECFAVRTYGKSFSLKIAGSWRNGKNAADTKTVLRQFHKIVGIRVSYGVYSMHVYDNQKGQGDFYAVSMEASIANNKMTEKWEIRNFSWNDRGIGPYAKEFEVWTQPLDPNGNVYSDQVVFFPAGTSPVPSTSQGSTTVNDEYSFSLKNDITLSGKGEMGKDGHGSKEMLSLELKVGVSMGWNWSKKVSRQVTDISISKLVSNNNEQKHMVVFNNLPKPDPDATCNWKEYEGNQSYKSTVDFNSAWVWHKPDVRDGSKEDPVTIKFVARYQYGWSWHDGAGLLGIGDYHPQEWTAERWVYQSFKLDPIVRERYGLVQLQNDFKDLYIYNIRVRDDKKFENDYIEFNKTYSPGSLISLSAYPVTGHYVVSFKAGKTATDAKDYVYVSHEYVPLDHMEPTVLKAAFDFKVNEQQQ